MQITTGHSPSKWLLLALAAIAVLTPALTCVSPRIMGAFFIGFGFTGMIAQTIASRRLPDFDFKLTLWICGLLGFGAISVFWSINAGDTISKIGQLTCVFIILAYLKHQIDGFPPHALDFLGRMLLIGTIIGAALYYFEWMSHFTLYDLAHPGNDDVRDNKQNKAIVMLALWAMSAFPYVFTLKNKTVHAVYAALIGAIGYATWGSPSNSAIQIAEVLPVLIAVVYFFPRRRFLIATAIAGMILLNFAMLPFARSIAIYAPQTYTSPSFSSSLKARLEIWDQASRRILERPLLGWGLNSSPSLPNRGEMLVSGDDFYPETPAGQVAHLHPHNAPLQIWFELGLPGMILLTLMLVMIGKGLDHIRDNRIAYAFGLIITAQTYLYTLSIWGIWQTWFIALICFTGLMGRAGIRRLQQK